MIAMTDKTPATARKRKQHRTHPATVTSDRLADHLDRWYDKTDGHLRDDISRVRAWLDDIAEGLR